MVQTAKQFSIMLDNKPARVAQVVTALAKEKINITAVTLSDHKNQHVMRLLTDDMAETAGVLQTLNVPFEENDVVLVEMRNQPGALAQVMEQLAAEHISIDYAYCAAGERNGKSTGVFKVSNPSKCMKVLAESPATRAKRDGHGGRGWGRTGRTKESTSSE
jgi:hypothetical protein